MVAGTGIATLGYILKRYVARKEESEIAEAQRKLKEMQEEARQASMAHMETIF